MILKLNRINVNQFDFKETSVAKIRGRTYGISKIYALSDSLSWERK